MTQTVPVPTAPKPAAAVTCSAAPLADTYPRVVLNVTLAALGDAIRARESEIGVDSLRAAEARSGYASLPAAKKYAVLVAQIRAAEGQVAAAERTFERAGAAEVLLKDNPTGTFADDLRRVAGEVEAARRAKLQAEADLSLIQGPAAKLFAAAANAVTSKARSDTTNLARSLDPAAKAAGEALEAACGRVAEIVRAAVDEHLVPLLVEQRATARACGEAYSVGRAFAAETVAAVLGPGRPDVSLKEGVYQVVPVEMTPEPILEPIPWPGA